MTATATLQKLLAAMPTASDREALRQAHEAGETFHGALARSLWWEREIEDTTKWLRTKPNGDADLESILADCQKHYADALGEAAVAMQKMPAVWLAILGVGIKAKESA